MVYLYDDGGVHTTVMVDETGVETGRNKNNNSIRMIQGSTSSSSVKGKALMPCCFHAMVFMHRSADYHQMSASTRARAIGGTS